MKRRSLLAGVLICGLLAFQTPALAARTFVDNGTTFNEAYFPTADVHNPSPTIPQPPTIHIDGKYLVTDVDPTIIDGRTLMPFRAAGEALGAEVSWDNNTRTAIAVKNGRTVRFTIGSVYYSINGITHQTSVAPTIINNRTLLPLRAFAEAFNAQVSWNHGLYDVVIDTNAPNAPSPNIPTDVSLDADLAIQKYYVAPDATDPYVGTWHYKEKAYYSGNTCLTDSYIFVSKYHERYHCVEVLIEDWSHWDTNIVTVMHDDAITHYDAQDDIEVFLVDYDQAITFYRGPARGWTLSYVNIYTLLGNSLLFTGNIDSNAQISQPQNIVVYEKL